MISCGSNSLAERSAMQRGSCTKILWQVSMADSQSLREQPTRLPTRSHVELGRRHGTNFRIMSARARSLVRVQFLDTTVAVAISWTVDCHVRHRAICLRPRLRIDCLKCLVDIFRCSCLNIVYHVSLFECFVQMLCLLVLPVLLLIHFDEICILLLQSFKINSHVL